ncbi:MAG: BON domain-containing protein, partial [Actinomycetota bacterium]
MSADDDLYSGESDRDGDQNELARLNALHDDLVEAVQTAINPTVRADLAAELRSVRERIAELSIGDGGADRRAPEPGQTVHSYEVPPAAEANGVASGYAGAPGGDGYDERYDAGGRGMQQPGLGDAPSYGYQQPDYGPGPGAGGPSYDDGRAYAAADPNWNRQPMGGGDPRYQGEYVRTRPERASLWSSRPWLPLVLAVLGGLLLAAIVGFGGLFGDDGDEGDTVASDDAGDPAGASSADGVVGDIRSMLDGMGFASVGVEERDGTVALSGTVGSDSDRQAVIGAASALSGGLAFDSSGLTVGGGEPAAATDTTVGPSDPAAVMQRELERILAGTPIVFEQGQVAVTERHQVILNNVVATMNAYPNQSVQVLGYTDDQ